MNKTTKNKITGIFEFICSILIIPLFLITLSHLNCDNSNPTTNIKTNHIETIERFEVVYTQYIGHDEVKILLDTWTDRTFIVYQKGSIGISICPFDYVMPSKPSKPTAGNTIQ